jgi:tetratricopeptide (TPR) repeat protein
MNRANLINISAALLCVFRACLCFGAEGKPDPIKNTYQADKEQEYRLTYKKAADSYLDGKYVEALEFLKKADESKPDQDKSENLKGAVYMMTKEYKKAEDAYTKALEINPRLNMARFNLGETLYSSRHYLKAKEYFQQYVKNEPLENNVTPLAKFKIIMCQYLSGEKQDIAKQMEQLKIFKSESSLCFEFCLVADNIFNKKNHEAFKIIGDIYRNHTPDKYSSYIDSFEEAGLLPKPTPTQVGQIMSSNTGREEIHYGEGNKLVLGFVDGQCFIFPVAD